MDMATPNSGDDVLDLERGGTHDYKDMAAPQSNDGLPVDFHIGGGGLSSPAPGPNPGGAKKKSSRTSEVDDSADSYTGAALMILALYYFFVFYMIGSSEEWWHAAVGIAVASAFLLLSFCMATCNQDFTTPLEERNVVKPPADSESDLCRRLIESDCFDDDVSTSGVV